MKDINLQKRHSIIYPKIGQLNSDLHVALVFGGLSEEREVSLSSGKVLCESFKNMEYCVTPIDMGYDISEVISKINPNIVFNALHGTYGEDGSLQGVLDILGIPYTHSNLTSSAIAFNKIYSQDIVKHNGINCPKRIILKSTDDLSTEPIARPFVIKPISQGSSIGVEVILQDDNFSLKDYQFLYGDEVIIEEYVPGKEIQVAILNGKVLGILEIELINKKFYDYQAKYQDGFTNHICPALLPQEIETKLIEASEKIHKILNCKGPTRLEFIYNPENQEIYFLEINTHPGITPLSIVPEIAMKNGIDFKNFVRAIINEALNEK